MNEREYERLRIALLDARNALALCRIRAHESRCRGHVCEATRAVDALHDLAAKGLLEANKALGFGP